jgi:hypothetical protein
MVRQDPGDLFPPLGYPFPLELHKGVSRVVCVDRKTPLPENPTWDKFANHKL